MEFERQFDGVNVGAAIRRPRSNMARIRRKLGEMVTVCCRAINDRPYNGVWKSNS